MDHPPVHDGNGGIIYLGKKLITKGRIKVAATYLTGLNIPFQFLYKNWKDMFKTVRYVAATSMGNNLLR